MKKCLLLLVLCFVLLPFVGNGQIITTYAGIGVGGDSGDGGPATLAKIVGNGWGVFDHLGNYYFTSGNWVNKVRKIIPTGVISTFAGDTVASSSGDGGQATAATLNNPEGIAVDKNNNIYIAEHAGARVRKVNIATGIISTIAGNGIAGYSGDGGPATNASLNGPYSLCFDPYGNLYIADVINGNIRKIDTNNVISTYAGLYGSSSGYSGDGGPATLAGLAVLNGICSDSKGNIYIAHYSNIRKIDYVTHIISRFAGNSISGFSGDGQVCDSASMNTPTMVAVDACDNLYIVDNGNNRIRKVDISTRKIITIAGNGNGPYNGDGGLADTSSIYLPSGVAVDTLGNIIINDLVNNRIRKVTQAKCDNSTHLGIEGVKSLGVTVYPNPVNSVLYVECETVMQSVVITNVLGQAVLKGESGELRAVVPVGQLAAGVYILEVVGDGGGIYREKIVRE